MSSPTSQVKKGVWIDQSQRQGIGWYSLMKESDIDLLTNALGIYLSFVLAASLVVFCIKIFRSLWLLRHPGNTSSQAMEMSDLLLKDGAGPGTISTIFTDHMAGPPAPSHPTGRAALTYYKASLTTNLRQHRSNCSCNFLCILFIVIILLGVGVIGTLTAFIKQSAVGLSSTVCSLYQPDENSTPFSPIRDIELESEEKARLYGQTCFGQAEGTEGCNVYIEQAIDFTYNGTSCPFSDDVCVSDAVHFDTGYQDSKILGHNVGPSWLWRRTSDCAAVSTNSTYVQTNVDESDTEYFYGNHALNGDFGNGINTTYLWNSSSQFEKQVPSYYVQAFRSTSDHETAYILPEFRVPNHTITILIIESGPLYYTNSRTDPIFPALNETSYTVDGLHLWYNGLYHGGVLMCADTWEICTHDRKSCWTHDTAPPAFYKSDTSPTAAKIKTTALDRSYAILWYGLLNSDTYHSIKSLGANGLDAQSHISNNAVTGISEQQWLVEAQILFRTGLARMQQDTLAIARGDWNDLPGWVDQLPRPAYSKMCGEIRFPVHGYRNVSLLGIVVTVGGSVLFWLLSREWREKILLVLLCRGVFSGIWKVCKLVGKSVMYVFDFVRQVC